VLQEKKKTDYQVRREFSRGDGKVIQTGSCRLDCQQHEFGRKQKNCSNPKEGLPSSKVKSEEM
jgi:hypothetical protein